MESTNAAELSAEPLVYDRLRPPPGYDPVPEGLQRESPGSSQARAVMIPSPGKRSSIWSPDWARIAAWAYRQLADKAADGDLKAFTFLLDLEHQQMDRSPNASDAHTSPAQALEIIKLYLDRQQKETRETNDSAPNRR